MVLTDNLDATGIDRSFTLSADVRLLARGKHTIFSTRTNDPIEIEKLTGLLKLVPVAVLLTKSREWRRTRAGEGGGGGGGRKEKREGRKDK